MSTHNIIFTTAPRSKERRTRLSVPPNEAVHILCFHQKKEKYRFFLVEKSALSRAMWCIWKTTGWVGNSEDPDWMLGCPNALTKYSTWPKSGVRVIHQTLEDDLKNLSLIEIRYIVKNMYKCIAPDKALSNPLSTLYLYQSYFSLKTYVVGTH